MKKCTKCKEIKDFSEFNKNKTKIDGLGSECKFCLSKIKKLYSRTKNGLIATIYGNQKNHSKRRNHKPPNYTLFQLKVWVFNNNLFNNLYECWVNSNFDKDLTPSIDRKKDNLPYSLDNIQLMTWIENNEKGHADMRSGKIVVTSNPQKPVLQFDRLGNFITEYISASQAERETNINRVSISAVCRKKKGCKTADGFIWKFKIK